VINGVRAPLTTHTSIRVSPSVKMTGSVVWSVMFSLPVIDNNRLNVRFCYFNDDCILDKYRSFWRITENISGNELNPGVQGCNELA